MPTKPATAPSTRRLSDVARHVVYPDGIVSTAWPRVEAECRKFGVRFDDPADEWERQVGSLALGKRADGRYAATVGGVVLSIPRQVAKTFLVSMILIALCLVTPGITFVWTAHRTRTSNRTFEKMKAYTSRRGVKGQMLEPRNTNGEQEIRFVNGSVIMFGAREQGFGRGFDEVDGIVFDEAQILTERALGDMIPAANQSRQPTGALVFYLGTPPRPVDPGEAFTERRNKALSGTATDMVYVEGSADPDASCDDREQWALANWSYPHRTPLESMLRMRELLGDDDSFRREALGIWDVVTGRRVIEAAIWDDVGDTASMPTERFALGVDVSPDRSTASVSFAGRRPDGLWHVELYDQRAGTAWLVPYVKARLQRNRIRAVVIDAIGPGASVIDDFTKERIRVTPTEARDMAHACGRFYDAVIEAELRHTKQPQVGSALAGAGKRPMLNGDLWAWNRKTATSDITPLVSCTLALWGAQTAKVKNPGHGGRTTTNGRRGTVS